MEPIKNPEDLDELTDLILGQLCDKTGYTPEGENIPIAWKAIRDALLTHLPAGTIEYLTDPELCFVSDKDGYWYKIPVTSRSDFYDWSDNIKGKYIAEEDLAYEYCEYSWPKYRCMPPLNYMFKDLKVLKEG
jgi:hypothetical protein